MMSSVIPFHQFSIFEDVGGGGGGLTALYYQVTDIALAMQNSRK